MKAPMLYNMSLHLVSYSRGEGMLRNRTLLAVSLAVFVAYTGIGMVGPVRVLYAQSQGASLAIIGAMASAYLVSNFLFQYPVGWLADRWGRKQVLVVGFLVQAMLALAYLFIVDPLQFVFLRLLEGVAAAGVLPAARALIVDEVPPEKRGEAYGIFGAAFNAGFLLGPGLGPARHHRLCQRLHRGCCLPPLCHCHHAHPHQGEATVADGGSEAQRRYPLSPALHAAPGRRVPAGLRRLPLSGLRPDRHAALDARPPGSVRGGHRLRLHDVGHSKHAALAFRWACGRSQATFVAHSHRWPGAGATLHRLWPDQRHLPHCRALRHPELLLCLRAARRRLTRRHCL